MAVATATPIFAPRFIRPFLNLLLSYSPGRAMDLEIRLETAKRTVRDAERRLERQRGIVAELEKTGIRHLRLVPS